MYTELFELGRKVLQEAGDALGISATSKTGTSPVAIATGQHKRTEIVKVPKNAAKSTIQAVGDDHMYEVMSTDRAGLAMPIAITQSSPKVFLKSMSSEAYVLENDKISVTIDNGLITSLIFRDLDREVIPKGRKGNQLVLFDDKPLYWQAWDVEVYHFETRKELAPSSVTVLESGPLRATLLVETKISEKSWIKTQISLDAAVEEGGQYLTFSSEVEWQEKMKFLKVEFPVDVHNTDATYETQYGVLRRPTHYNTSWDMAKFEVCNQRFADLSEFNFGVSILNDCK